MKDKIHLKPVWASVSIYRFECVANVECLLLVEHNLVHGSWVCAATPCIISTQYTTLMLICSTWRCVAHCNAFLWYNMPHEYRHTNIITHITSTSTHTHTQTGCTTRAIQLRWLCALFVMSCLASGFSSSSSSSSYCCCCCCCWSRQILWKYAWTYSQILEAQQSPQHEQQLPQLPHPATPKKPIKCHCKVCRHKLKVFAIIR